MTAASWALLKRLFSEAIECPAGQRAAFLDRACAGDAELRASIDALIARHAGLGSFLEPREAVDLGGELPANALGPVENAQEHVGELVAARYRLRELLGRGGSGAVYRAEDALSGGSVAVKLLWNLRGAWPEAARREVAALRHLRLPGVVSLLDDGVECGTPFLVMELVHGDPFPGAGVHGWAKIAPRAAALLEALGRVHWAGVIHRDLKPGNVIVDGAGRVTILDLGIAAGRALVDDPAAMPLACTADYAAPELFGGAPPSERSDLYAVGVILYQSLTGRIPHRDGPEDEFFERRIREAGPALESDDPDIGPAVRALLARLLARDPADRPASAAEVMAQLGIHVETALPRLGGTGPLDDLLAALRGGGSVWIAGLPGSGRSRLLADLRERLRREGRRFMDLEAGGAPFASLDAVLGGPSLLSGLKLEEVEAIALQRLGKALSDGVILLCDDCDRFDRWSAQALRRTSALGTVVHVVREAEGAHVRLEPLLERDLRALFAGPDRLFHLREDAAHELWRRTGGLPARVEAELGAWVRSGLARREDAGFVLERAALERLGQGVPARIASLPVRADLPPRLAELLEALDLTGGGADPELLARVTVRPAWRVEAELIELEELGAVRRGVDLVQALAGVAPGAGLGSAEARRRIAAALPVGSDQRLFHLISAGEISSVPAEAIALADRWSGEGFVGRAFAVLLEGLAAVRAGPSEGEGDLLARLVEQALALATRDAFDQVLYHLARARLYDARVQQLEALARAALWTIGGDGGRALDLIADLDVGGSPKLVSLKRSIEGLASRYVPLERGRRTVALIASAARRSAGREARRACLEQLGWLRYRENRFARAAHLHERAARHATTRSERASALLNAASARMEDHDLAGAEALAEEAHALTARTRHPIQEARSEWLLRTIRYRKPATLTPDFELLEAAADLDFPNFQGLIFLNEAAVAWRAGDDGTAVSTAQRAAEFWGNAGRTYGKMLADALALVAGATLGAEERERILRAAIACPVPGMAVQALGLLAAADPVLRERALEHAWEAAARIPRDHWSHRREVLSVLEALDELAPAAVPPAKGADQDSAVHGARAGGLNARGF